MDDKQSRPLERRVFREEIREKLIEDILNGRLAPGSRIVETRIAQQFGVSQGPVREALRDLELFGFVVCSPFRGTQVRTDLHRGAARDLPDQSGTRRSCRARRRRPYRSADARTPGGAHRSHARGRCPRRSSGGSGCGPQLSPRDRQGVWQSHARAPVADDAALDHDLPDGFHHPSIALRDCRAPRRGRRRAAFRRSRPRRIGDQAPHRRAGRVGSLRASAEAGRQCGRAGRDKAAAI